MQLFLRNQCVISRGLHVTKRIAICYRGNWYVSCIQATKVVQMDGAALAPGTFVSPSPGYF